MGPMQFLPGTWSRYASDGNGDGKADVQNVYDASLAAARYLCSGGLNLRDQSQVMTAILRYNNSMAYAQNVLGWAAAYATGVVPVDLPPITGPIPPIADMHLDNYQGLGPGLPMNALGLPADDPLAVMPLVDATRTDVASQMFGPLPGPADCIGARRCSQVRPRACRRGCRSLRSRTARCSASARTRPRRFSRSCRPRRFRRAWSGRRRHPPKSLGRRWPNWRRRRRCAAGTGARAGRTAGHRRTRARPACLTGYRAARPRTRIGHARSA